MNRSGYTDDCENLELYRQAVDRAIRGSRGQAFLRELAREMDAMPVKELISDQLIDVSGGCCAIGVVCKARGIDVSSVEYFDAESVANLVGVARSLAAEIEYENDESYAAPVNEGSAQRWQRMRRWVQDNLHEEAVAPAGA